MSYFSTPPSAAIKEANDHLQALYDNNLKLEKEIDDLRDIIVKKQEREQHLVDEQELLKEQYERKLVQQRERICEEYEQKLCEQFTTFEEEKKHILLGSTNQRANEQVTEQMNEEVKEVATNQPQMVDEEKGSGDQTQTEKDKAIIIAVQTIEDTQHVEKVAEKMQESQSEEKMEVTNDQLNTEANVGMTDDQSSIKSKLLGPLPGGAVLDRQEKLVVTNKREDGHENIVNTLQNIIAEQDDKILLLETEIKRLIDPDSELSKRVGILEEIMKYKCAISNIMVCLEHADELIANTSHRNDNNNNVNGFLDIETNV